LPSGGSAREETFPAEEEEMEATEASELVVNTLTKSNEMSNTNSKVEEDQT
jgi:hypothetical protein